MGLNHLNRKCNPNQKCSLIIMGQKAFLDDFKFVNEDLEDIEYMYFKYD